MTDRPAAVSRSPTAPPAMATNGHFASIGDHSDKAAYEHGVQVVDENKEFKYASFTPLGIARRLVDSHS